MQTLIDSEARLYGVVPPLVTPFADDNATKVDHTALAALCEFLIESRVHGLYPCGTTGENALLLAEERMAIAETVISAARGRVPVFVHVGAAGTAETVLLARHAIAHGADGIGAITPYYYAYAEEDLRCHYQALAEAATPCPVYLYNLPSYARNAVSLTLADTLRQDAANIIGIKDSSGDLEALRAFRALPNFSVLSGSDGRNLAALELGCDGMISGNANAVPEPFVALWNAWQAGDTAGTTEAQRRIDVARMLLSNGARLADFKAVLVARGILSCAAVRAPHPPAEDGRRLLSALEEASCLLQGEHSLRVPAQV